MQHEITRPISLLDKEGNLTEPGYAKRLWPVYDRARVRGGLARLKEWDSYLVMGEGFALSLTIADGFHMGLDAISLLDFSEGWQVTRRRRRAGNAGLPVTSAEGSVGNSGRGYGLFFQHDGKRRFLAAHMDQFGDGSPLDVSVELTDEPEESMVICTPLGKPGHFCMRQKINCMRASGKVSLGDRNYIFKPERDFGVLNWGRGIWTGLGTWYWSSLSTLVNGVPFGMNLGYGFGDDSAATENMFLYDGKVHKLERVRFHIPTRDGREIDVAPWTIRDDAGRLALTFTPMLHRVDRIGAGVSAGERRQVFGRFSGRAFLDDGRGLELKDTIGVAEAMKSRR